MSVSRTNKRDMLTLASSEGRDLLTFFIPDGCDKTVISQEEEQILKIKLIKGCC